MTGAKDVVITLGKDGMSIFTENKDVVRVPTFARKVFDVTGAGDTVIAALALGVTTGMTSIPSRAGSSIARWDGPASTMAARPILRQRRKAA